MRTLSSCRLNKPGCLYIVSVLIFMQLFLPGCRNSAPSSPIQPVSLRCEYQADPIGIDNRTPMLSWLFHSSNPDARGLKQSAYHILVASSKKYLDKEQGDMWDSGIIRSDKNQVIYEGISFKSQETFFWKVKVFDGEGNVYPLSKIMHAIKGSTARYANQLLGRQGAFWQHESYDHVVRDPEEFRRIVHYIMENPVRAGLPPRWVYCRAGC